MSDGASRRRSDVGCRTKFIAHPWGVIFYPVLKSKKYMYFNLLLPEKN